MSVARESLSNETRAASTPSIDVPDMMPMYSVLISRKQAQDRAFVREDEGKCLLSLTRYACLDALRHLCE